MAMSPTPNGEQGEGGAGKLHQSGLVLPAMTEFVSAKKLPPCWRAALDPVLASEASQRLSAWLDDEAAAGKRIYPASEARLRAFELTPLDAVKVVILGQDPYHGEGHGSGQAMGLSFSVPRGLPLPPSLRNIYKELVADCGIEQPQHGDLTRWAQQGVLLLNATLSVERGKAGSHAGFEKGGGWEAITDAALSAVAQREAPSVFILWGSHAQKQASRIAALRDGLGQDGPHLLIESPHPSPLAAYRGFFGSKPFSQANAFLAAHERGAIDWSLA